MEHIDDTEFTDMILMKGLPAGTEKAESLARAFVS